MRKHLPLWMEKQQLRIIHRYVEDTKYATNNIILEQALFPDLPIALKERT